MKDKLNVIVVFGSKIIIALMGILILALETRFITPSVLGEYSLLSGIINAGVSLCVSWVGSSALRYYDAHKKELSGFNTTVLVEGIVSIVILIIGMTILGFLSPKLYIEKHYLLVIVLTVFKSIYEIYEKVLRAAANFVVYSILTVLQYVLNVGFFYVLAKEYPNNISSVFIAMIVSLAIFDFLAVHISNAYAGVSPKRFDKELNSMFLRYGVPMIGTWAISWLLNYADRYMINLFYTTREVGIYTTAYTVSQSAIGIFISSITLTFFPILIRRWNKEGREATAVYVNKIIDYYLMFIIPGVVGLSVISKEFYGTLIDMKYVEGASVIILSSIGFMFMGLNNIIYKLWQLEEKTNRIMGLMLVSLFINIITNAILLPMFGFTAAAYTTAFSYLIIFAAAFIWVKRSFDVKIEIVQVLKSVISVIPMCGALIVLKPYIKTCLGLILSVMIAGMLYMVMQLAFGNFRAEIGMLKDKLKRKEKSE